MRHVLYDLPITFQLFEISSPQERMHTTSIAKQAPCTCKRMPAILVNYLPSGVKGVVIMLRCWLICQDCACSHRYSRWCSEYQHSASQLRKRGKPANALISLHYSFGAQSSFRRQPSTIRQNGMLPCIGVLYTPNGITSAS